MLTFYLFIFISQLNEIIVNSLREKIRSFLASMTTNHQTFIQKFPNMRTN